MEDVGRDDSTPATEPLAALVQGARGGDRECRNELARRHYRLVHGVLLSRLPSWEAEDLLQEVLLHALDRLEQLDDDNAFGAWVCAIARRRATDWLRSARSTAELVDQPVNDPRRSEAEQVVRAIHALPEAYREPLVLRLLYGMSGAEIAHRTGLSPGSVRVNLHRGFKFLRASLEMNQ